jgi:hypothetical protein
LYSLISWGRSSSCESVLGLFGHFGGLNSFGLVVVELHKLGKIELGLLEDLDLSDEDVLKGEDLGAVLGDLLGDLVGDELLEEILQGVLGDLGNHNFHHLLAELLGLGSLSVASSLDLVSVTAGETDSKHADEVTILGLGLDEGLDEGVPLLDEGTEFVAGDVHTVEVGVAIETLDFLNLDLDLSPGNLMSIVVELTKGDGEDTATEGVGGLLLTGRLVARGEGGDTDIEDGGNVNVVPFLLVESVDSNQLKQFRF